jgi:hypothetical protein
VRKQRRRPASLEGKEGNSQLEALGLLAAAALAPVPILRLPPDSARMAGE